MTPTKFNGSLYSYDDARKRAPEAWRLATIQGDGWSREEWEDIAPMGLGHFEDGGPLGWVYIRPNGYAVSVAHSDGCHKPEPPPLPRPEAARLTCGCGEKTHVCGACGQPNWIELHGCADGYCTYCYYHG